MSIPSPAGAGDHCRQPCRRGSGSSWRGSASRGWQAACPLLANRARSAEGQGAQRRHQTRRATGAAGAHGARQGPEGAQRERSRQNTSGEARRGASRNDRGSGAQSEPPVPPDKLPHKAPTGATGERGGGAPWATPGGKGASRRDRQDARRRRRDRSSGQRPAKAQGEARAANRTPEHRRQHIRSAEAPREGAQAARPRLEASDEGRRRAVSPTAQDRPQGAPDGTGAQTNRDEAADGQRPAFSRSGRPLRAIGSDGLGSFPLSFPQKRPEGANFADFRIYLLRGVCVCGIVCVRHYARGGEWVHGRRARERREKKMGTAQDASSESMAKRDRHHRESDGENTACFAGSAAQIRRGQPRRLDHHRLHRNGDRRISQCTRVLIRRKEHRG